MALETGALLDGKYRILHEVGRGGMSIVYMAINEKANKTWAVKEVRKDGVLDFEAVRQGLIVETEMLKDCAIQIFRVSSILLKTRIR